MPARFGARASWRHGSTREVPSMELRLLRCLFAIAAAALPPAAQPDPIEQEPPSAPACRAPEYDGPLMLNREKRITQFEGLGERCLKRLVVECNAAASREILDPGSAFACSLGYEALLKRGFGGDFQAMLGWWRTRAEDGSRN
jgi:hypothetical protein